MHTYALCALLATFLVAIGCGSSAPPGSSTGISTQSPTCEEGCNDHNSCTEDSCFDNHCFNTNLPDGTDCALESWPSHGTCLADGEDASVCKFPDSCTASKPGEACPGGLCDAVGHCCSDGCLDTNAICQHGMETEMSGMCRVCFLNSDCLAAVDADDACAVRCDPTGHQTTPGSTVSGCYVTRCGAGMICDDEQCVPEPFFCMNSGQCDDGNPCTTDTCTSSTGKCAHGPTSGHQTCDTGVCLDRAGTCCAGCNADNGMGGYVCVASCPGAGLCFDGFCLP